MERQPSSDSRVLLEQVNWVRALARRLIDDRHEAEDVAQDALVVALGAGGEEPVAPRRWLGGIVRNLTRNRRRRRRWERVEARPEPAAFPSALELTARAGMQRALVDAVLELPEADRTVVLLRYFQELSNEDAARALGIPASTAASRLARALAKLEAKWRARHGDEGAAMLAALAGLVPEASGTGSGRATPGARAPRATPGTLGFAAATVAAGAIVVVGGSFYASTAGRGMSGPAAVVPPSAPPPATLATASAPAAALAAFLQEGRRAVHPDPVPPSAPATCPSALAVPVRIQGRVLDLEGRAVAGLELRRVAPLVSLPGEWTPRGAPTDQQATSDEDGRFELEVPALGWLEPVTPGWALVFANELGLARDGAETTLVVARSTTLGGVVRDPDGMPLAGVTLLLEPLLPLEDVPGLPPAGLMSFPVRLESGADGAFHVPRVAPGRARLALSREGFLPRTEELEIPLAGEGLLTFVLEPSDLPQVRGLVRDTEGRPVVGAEVSLGQEIVTTTSTGAFLVSFDPEHDHRHEGARLRAAHPRAGSAQRSIELPASGEEPPEVEIVLAEGSHAVRGRVLDPQGAPVPGLEVFVLEETGFGWMRAPGGGLRYRSLEEALGAVSKRTSADGRFRLTGLATGPYRVQVLEPDALLSVVTEPLAPDAPEVTVRFDPRARGPIAGRIVDADGVPLEGVRVSVSLRRWWSGPEDRGFDLAIGTDARTDREGRFRLEDVARAGVFLRIEGEAVVPELFREIDGEDRTALELVVGRRAGLRIAWGTASTRAERLHLEDGHGRVLPFAKLKGLGITPLTELPVERGTSPVLTIPAHTAVAVLTRDGEEVERVPLQPVAGETVTLEL